MRVALRAAVPSTGSGTPGDAARQDRAHRRHANRGADAAGELVERGGDARGASARRRAAPRAAATASAAHARADVRHDPQQRRRGRVARRASVRPTNPAVIRTLPAIADDAVADADGEPCAPTTDMVTQPRNSGVSTWPASVAVPPMHRLHEQRHERDGAEERDADQEHHGQRARDHRMRAAGRPAGSARPRGARRRRRPPSRTPAAAQPRHRRRSSPPSAMSSALTPLNSSAAPEPVDLRTLRRAVRRRIGERDHRRRTATRTAG